MGDGPNSDWYKSLAIAPWTPPGWVFGVAWITIMVCFTFYMAQLWEVMDKSKSVVYFFGLQWVLNVIWNPVFFHFHQIFLGLIVIVFLSGLVIYFLFGFWSQLKLKSLWVLPYALWLLIATSLNAYILLNN